MSKPLGIFLASILFALCVCAAAQDSTETPNSSTLASLKDADVTPPRPIHEPDPKYPAESRRAGIQGSSWISMIVGTDGIPHDLRVVRKLDDTLDERALETVRTWRFKPATKDDRPVEVELVAKIMFHLKGENYQKIGDLWQRSDASDPKAEWALYKAYRDGAGVPQDDSLALWFLKRAAGPGTFPKPNSKWASISTKTPMGRATMSAPTCGTRSRSGRAGRMVSAC